LSRIERRFPRFLEFHEFHRFGFSGFQVQGSGFKVLSSAWVLILELGFAEPENPRTREPENQNLGTREPWEPVEPALDHGCVTVTV
jgi:hypothetical protein